MMTGSRDTAKPKDAFSLSTDLNDVILLLENSACQWALASVVQPVGVCSVLQEELDEVGVAVVCGQHELLCLSVTARTHTDGKTTMRNCGGKERAGM